MNNKDYVDSIIDTYMNYDYYIPYEFVDSFVSDIKEVLTENIQEMIDLKQYYNAFKLSSYILFKINYIDIEDAEDIPMLSQICLDNWNTIINICDKEVSDKIFAWFVDKCSNDFVDEILVSFFMEHFKERNYLKEKLKFTQQKVNFIRHNDSQKSKWLSYHLQVMYDLGYSDDKLMKYCKGNWKYHSMRQAYIDLSLKQNNYNEAIVALNHSIKLDKYNQKLVASYHHQLKDIYQLLGSIEEYKQQLKLLIKFNPNNLDDYRELKSLYTQEAWNEIREDIFLELSDSDYIAVVYKEEGLYDRLLKYVIDREGLVALENYEEDLKDKYPKQLLRKYTRELNVMVQSCRSRRDYRNLIDIMKRMLQIRGGSIAVFELINDWKVRYKNRYALLEELNQLQGVLYGLGK
ncbi:MAG: hypothetical protein LUG60_04390 [Erysipelotrichaceae bacterium]|nr:hypothetical protein [Erysipelotrichaceae bacterium]